MNIEFLPVDGVAGGLTGNSDALLKLCRIYHGRPVNQQLQFLKQLKNIHELPCQVKFRTRAFSEFSWRILN
jgi:hypothetical protein